MGLCFSSFKLRRGFEDNRQDVDIKGLVMEMLILIFGVIIICLLVRLNSRVIQIDQFFRQLSNIAIYPITDALKRAEHENEGFLTEVPNELGEINESLRSILHELEQISSRFDTPESD